MVGPHGAEENTAFSESPVESQPHASDRIFSAFYYFMIINPLGILKRWSWRRHGGANTKEPPQWILLRINGDKTLHYKYQLHMIFIYH